MTVSRESREKPEYFDKITRWMYEISQQLKTEGITLIMVRDKTITVYSDMHESNVPKILREGADWVEKNLNEPGESNGSVN